MRNIHLTTWKMTKSLKNVKNEKCKLLDLEYGEKTENHGKWEIHTLGPEIWRGKMKKGGIFRNVHWTSWNMARKLKIMENEKHPLDHLKNDEITAKREKWEMDTVGPGIWRENWKSRIWEIHTLGREIWRTKLKKVENLEMYT